MKTRTASAPACNKPPAVPYDAERGYLQSIDNALANSFAGVDRLWTYLADVSDATKEGHAPPDPFESLTEST